MVALKLNMWVENIFRILATPMEMFYSSSLGLSKKYQVTSGATRHFISRTGAAQRVPQVASLTMLEKGG